MWVRVFSVNLSVNVGADVHVSVYTFIICVFYPYIIDAYEHKRYSSVLIFLF